MRNTASKYVCVGMPGGPPAGAVGFDPSERLRTSGNMPGFNPRVIIFMRTSPFLVVVSSMNTGWSAEIKDKHRKYDRGPSTQMPMVSCRIEAATAGAD